MATSPFPFFPLPPPSPPYHYAAVYPPPPPGFVPVPASPSPIPTQIDHHFPPTPIHHPVQAAPHPSATTDHHPLPFVFSSAYAPAPESGFSPNWPIRHPAPPAPAPAPLARNPASPAAAIHPPPHQQLLPVETPPPPQYGFHNLDRRTMLLADGTVRTYFALPLDCLHANFLDRIPEVTTVGAAASVVLGADLTRGNDAGGVPMYGEQLVHKHTGSNTLSMVNVSPNHRFILEDAAAVPPVAHERVPATDTTLHRLQQQERDQLFDTIQGQLEKITSIVSQFSNSLGKQSILANASKPERSQQLSNVPVAAHVAPQVLGVMPTPKSCPRTSGSALHYYQEQGTPVQSTFWPGRNTTLSEQYLDELSPHYGLDNLNCQTIVVADGTEHSYYARPEQSPLEQAPSEPVFEVPVDEKNGSSNDSVHVCTGTHEQQPYQEEQQKDLQDFTLRLQQHDDERALNCPVLEASDSNVTRDNQLSFMHRVKELRLLWDPGASASLVTHLNPACVAAQVAYLTLVPCPKVDITSGSESLLVHNLQALVTVPDYHTGPMEMHVYEEVNQESEHLLKCFSKGPENEQTNACLNRISGVFDYVPKQQPYDDAQQVNKHQVNRLITDAGKQKWDPGIRKTLMDISQVAKWSSVTLRLRDPSWNALIVPELIAEWDPGDKKIHDLLPVAADATKLQCREVYRRSDAFGLGCTEVNAAALPVLAVPHSAVTSLAKHSLILLSQDASDLFEEMPVYDVYEEDTNASLNFVVELSDTVGQHKQYDGEKPIYDHEEPHGAAKLSSEESDNELLTECFNKASDNALSEEATDFTFSHGPVIHAERSIKLTNEKSTQVASMLSIHEANMHCHDERSELNIKKQDVLINKHNITYSCDLNNDKEVPFVLHYQLPLSSTPCIWDPGIRPSSSMCYGLQSLTAGAVTEQPSSSLQTPVPTTCQNQVTNASYAWDPVTTMLLQYNSIWLLLFKEDKERVTLIPKQWSCWFKAMHNCQIFQKCNALSFQQYSHQDINLYGIPLWLITFNPP